MTIKIGNMHIKVLLGFILLSTYSFGQSLKVVIDNVYNFKPSKLSKAEQESKFPAMDKLFKKITDDTARYLPQLRSELIAGGHNPYFYYDGSALLLSTSKNYADKKLIAKSLVKADLDDLNPEQYTRMLNLLANQGVDITEAGLKVLQDDKYKFFLPQHVFTFDQAYSLSYILLPEDMQLYTDKLISIFKTSGPVAQKSIITVLWYGYSCKGDALINECISDKSLNADVRSYAKDIMTHSKMNRDEEKYVKSLNKTELQKLRSDALKRFSDEAVGELDLSTKVLRKEGACR
jgi:hypothetical protein